VPTAKQVPFARTFHGDSVTDLFAWLGDKDDPETIAFLTGENAYTEALTAGQEGLRETIFGEIRGRTRRPTCRSRPQGRLVGTTGARSRASSTACSAAARRSPPRMSAEPAEGEPLPGRGNPAGRERPGRGLQLLLAGASSVSPDARRLAYSPTSAHERFTLRIKDLGTGEILPDEIRAPSTGAPGHGTARRCSTSRWTRPGAMAGVAPHGRLTAHRRRVIFEEPTRSSGSGWA